MTTPHSSFDPPAWVYEAIGRMAPPQWVRLVVRIRKVGAAESWVLGRQQYAFVSDGADFTRADVNFATSDDKLDFADWAEEDIDVEDWVEAFLTVDVDGTRTATIRTDSAGPTDDFLELHAASWEDDYVESHREELAALSH